MTETVFLRGQRHEISECITCGVVYTVPQIVMTKQRELGGYHHCPNGHQQGWSKDGSELERVRRERDRLKQETARLEEEARAAQDAEQKAVQSLKRHKKRSASGTCPCCKRTFSALAAHMKTQHPEFIAETGAKVIPLKRA